MRVSIAPLGGLLLAVQIVANAQGIGVQTRYPLGRLVGECLSSKCQIFQGTLLTVSPTESQSVLVHLEKSMFGNATPGAVVALPYVNPEAVQVKGYDPLREVWRASRLSFRQNESVIVLLALERMRSGKAGDPLLVTSNESLAEAIRTVIDQAERIQADPESFPVAELALPDNAGTLLAGYLVAYVTDGVMKKNFDTGISLLSKLVQYPSVPDYARSEIVRNMGAEYAVLSSSTRSVIVRGFVSLAESVDGQVARRGFDGLAQIDYFHGEVRPVISSSDMEKLNGSYRALVQKGVMQRTQSLEEGLGIQYK